MGIQSQEGQYRLIHDVIDQGICVRCGACVGLCPYFDYVDGNVVVMDRCNADTWRCLQLCPRAGYEGIGFDSDRSESAKNREIGTYKNIFMAQAKDNATEKRSQYGGVVSALIIYALEKGYIKSAVLTDKGNHLSPGGKLVTSRKGVLDCAGSRYSGSGSLSALNTAIAAGENRLGVVGLPCQMEALGRMKRMKPDGEEKSNRIGLRIGLFCTWAIDYRKLDMFLKRKGVEGPIKKYDIPPPPAEKFQVQNKSGWIDFPLSEIRQIVQKGCGLCQDMTAEWADISVGAVEGYDGWNTVVIRTDTGSRVVNRAIKDNRLITSQLPEENLTHLKESSRIKRERGRKGMVYD